jgi:3-hydroxyisobutyrate dehydrogenase-like beta-hydroxyacid dehydrogenase
VSERVGLIGIGEAGAAIGGGLTAAGHQVLGYDTVPAAEQRAAGAGVELVPSLAALAAGCDVLVCLTNAKAAVSVAAQLVPALTARHLYADWNSASPEVKQRVAETVSPSGARFVDGAVMAAVPPKRHRVPVLLSGAGAADLHAFGERIGLNTEVLGDEPGQASAVKMFRSLLVKGLESLILECALGAHAHGVTDRVLDSMAGSLPMHDWHELATYLMTRSVTHAERRASELSEVGDTLDAAGVEPLLARAGAARLRWLAELHVADRLAGPADYRRILDLIAKEQS